MLHFNTELEGVYNKVKEEYALQPFIPIEYPKGINNDNWEDYENSITIPQVQGCLYFIFNEKKELLYIGKSKAIDFALKSHLVRRTSPTTSSILDTIKKEIDESDKKKIFIKVLDIEPVELAATIKPFLIRDFKPKLSKRLS